ncbi:hypothetical protein CBS14141_001670 [Malassezia furfur]|nr:hypothetical protein CBS14141_001670 [Malassezia furfur]
MTSIAARLRACPIRAASPSVRWGVRALSTLPTTGPMRVRRSLLYIPGSSEKMLVKSRSVPADTLVYDLEDSVAEHRKGAAQGMAAPSDSSELSVRINAPSTQRALAGSDLEVILQSERLDAVVIPKCESVDDITFVAQHIAQAHTSPSRPVSLILSVESASCLVRLPTLLQEAQARLADEFRGAAAVAAVLFASEDYCASTGVRRTRSRKGLLYPRAKMVTIAKAMGIEAIDQAYLKDECDEGAELGFDGKQAIHPAQLDTIRRAFSPTEHDIEEAKAILAAYENASRKQDKGAVGLDYGGRSIMIDAPMLLQAQRTLARAQGV